MPTMDVFNNDAFSLRSLTAAINAIPFKPGRLGALRLFQERGITTTTIQVESKAGTLSLIQTSPRGGPAATLGRDKRTLRAFTVPHLAKEATIVADEVQGVRAFGTESDVETVQSMVDDRLAVLKSHHEVTLEHLRIGALKGLILDADLTTIYNLFTEFGVAQQTYQFDFGDEDEDIRGACVETKRLIESALGAGTYSGARALCSPSFFDGLVAHPQVKEAFKYQEGQMLQRDLRDGFTFGGITFEEYCGSVGAVSFITDGEAYCFPENAMVEGGPLFRTFFAPADFEETVNTIGLPYYAKQAADPEFNRWRKLHTQSNPLPMCLIPRTVIKLTMTELT
jgi:hypothetical protein